MELAREDEKGKNERPIRGTQALRESIDQSKAGDILFEVELEVTSVLPHRVFTAVGPHFDVTLLDQVLVWFVLLPAAAV